MKVCPSCGKMYLDTYLFCTIDGEDLQPVGAPAAAGPEAAASGTQRSKPTGGGQPSSTPGRNSLFFSGSSASVSDDDDPAASRSHSADATAIAEASGGSEPLQRSGTAGAPVINVAGPTGGLPEDVRASAPEVAGLFAATGSRGGQPHTTPREASKHWKIALALSAALAVVGVMTWLMLR